MLLTICQLSHLFSNSEATMLSMPVSESFNTYDNPCSWRRVRCQTSSWVLSTPRHRNHQPLTLFVTHSFMFSTHNWILQNLSRYKKWYSSQWNESIRIIKLIHLLWKKLLLAWSPFSTDTWPAYRAVVCLSPRVKAPRSDELPLLHVCKANIHMCDQTFWLSRHMSR